MEDLVGTSIQGEQRQLLSLSNQTFEQLLQLGLDLNHIYILENPDLQFTNPKLLGWRQTLLRKGLIEADMSMSPKGSELLKNLTSGVISLPKRRKERRESVTADFERWWDAYPATNAFTYKGKSFSGSRAIRIKKNECQVKFGAIVEGGRCTGQEMIDALLLEKRNRMEESLKLRENKMTYFTNSLSYLNQGQYEAWIELLREGKPQVIENQEIKRIDI